MAIWKKVVLALSLVLGCVGFAVARSAEEEAPAPAAATAPGVTPASLQGTDGAFPPFTLPGQEGQPAPEPESAAPLWAPLLAKGGLSFFLAFCIGYALRTFLKGTMLVVGVVALAIFGLRKAGVIEEINWDVAQGYWDDLTANIGAQFESLKTFVTGSLPSAASGGVGLVAGFRR